MSDFILYMPYVCKHPTAYENHKISRNALLSARDLSSAGRASALQAEGHRFEPCRSHLTNYFISYADVAQLAEQLICNQQVIGSSPIIGFLDL